MNAIISMAGFGILPLQAQPTASVWEDPMILFYTVVGFIFITTILVLIVAVYLLQVIRRMTEIAGRESAAARGVTYVEEPGWWSKLTEVFNRSVPMEKEETIMLEHNYDGIRELDNFLPPWWKWLFYATIVWGAFYLVAYHITGSMPLQDSEYQAEVTVAAEQLRAQKSGDKGPAIDENTVEATAEGVALADGKETFNSICASCHKVDGGGDIGPNLTDKFWKHGGDIKSIFKVVTHGVTGTNMVAWGTSMSPEKIRNVSSYVLTLQGTNPPNAKKPEGTEYVPAVDSVKATASVN
ncbi:MAG: cbb3-type cytochrome c oxidase N-terminal domain-containing protein [Bacteroidota bacterium]